MVRLEILKVRFRANSNKILTVCGSKKNKVSSWGRETTKGSETSWRLWKGLYLHHGGVAAHPRVCSKGCGLLYTNYIVIAWIKWGICDFML